MITISILEDEDLIQENDLCRPLDESTSYDIIPVNSLSCRSGSPVNNLKYVYVEEIIPHWIGNSVGELNTSCIKYEIIRGKVPNDLLFNYKDTREYSGWVYGRYVRNIVNKEGTE